MAIFRGQGFLFYFLLAAPHPFIAHSIRCGATLMLLPAGGGIPARFPACLLLPIAAGTDACRLLYAKPAVELPVMTLHAGLFGLPIGSFLPLQCQGCGWPADFMPGTTGRVCLLVSCGHVLPKPVASCSTFSLLLLAEVTIIFRRKDSSGRTLDNLDQCTAVQIFLYRACGFGRPKIKSICWQSLVHPFAAPTFWGIVKLICLTSKSIEL